MHLFRETVYSADGQKVKCHFNHCEHKTESMGENTHDEGVCWKITQEEFADKPTNAKYCPCKKDNEFIRRYERVGYMEREQHDQMITRACKGCGQDCLFTIHDTECIACKTGRFINEPIPGYVQLKDGSWVEDNTQNPVGGVVVENNSAYNINEPLL